ncbi:MAG: histidine phosphatase family protein [Planctomycetales bacterium]|nr:histidine phosphatase family protein [Planctomycetales bacterium]
MLEILLIRPGCTQFDEDGRIKGALDIPLSSRGVAQARALAISLQHVKLDFLYIADSESAVQTAKEIAEHNFCRQRILPRLTNLDHGLWQGKLLSEVKRLQPRVYRQFQERPSEVCPPGGEMVLTAVDRVQDEIQKLVRHHPNGRVGVLVPEPLASIVRFTVQGGSLGDLWKSELDFGTVERLLASDSRLQPV